MMELKIASRTCRDQAGEPRTFHYALTVDTGEHGGFCCENYGVRVWEEQGGDETVSGITTSASRIDELMTLLVDNQVGPAGLRDVVDDWL